MAAIMAGPGTAQAQPAITGATIDGGVSTWSPPGGVIPASIQIGTGWRSTAIDVGGSHQCVTRSGTATGAGTQSSNFTAPRRPHDGDDVTIRAYPSNACAGTPGAARVLTNALRVTQPRANPGISPQCGLNVMLVLDASF